MEDCCAICLEPAPDFKTPCKHMFHNNCAAQWFKYNMACPLCMKKHKMLCLEWICDEIMTEFKGMDEIMSSTWQCDDVTINIICNDMKGRNQGGKMSIKPEYIDPLEWHAIAILKASDKPATSFVMQSGDSAVSITSCKVQELTCKRSRKS